MIVGTGCDVLYIERVNSLIGYNNFLDKYFTYSEINMFKAQQNNKNYVKKIASNLCVKEAFFKSISHITRNFRFKDVEILRDNSGRPYINLFNDLKLDLEGIKVHVTISNEKDIVISFVALEKFL